MWVCGITLCNFEWGRGLGQDWYIGNQDVGVCGITLCNLFKSGALCSDADLGPPSALTLKSTSLPAGGMALMTVT